MCLPLKYMNVFCTCLSDGERALGAAGTLSIHWGHFHCPVMWNWITVVKTLTSSSSAAESERDINLVKQRLPPVIFEPEKSINPQLISGFWLFWLCTLNLCCLHRSKDPGRNIQLNRFRYGGAGLNLIMVKIHKWKAKYFVITYPKSQKAH